MKSGGIELVLWTETSHIIKRSGNKHIANKIKEANKKKKNQKKPSRK
jgi:hypothetical protein